MRIVHINLQKSWRGGEQQLAYLMASLQSKGIFQLLICLENSALEKFAIQNDISYISLKKGFIAKITNIRKLHKVIKTNRINIIHCHESKGHSLAFFTKIILGIDAKIVVHRRVVFPIKGFFSKKFKYSEKYIDTVICISKAVEQVFWESTGNKNTVIIHSMTDLDFDYSDKNILSKYNIPNKTIIGYIGAFTFEKDHYTFLDTAKNLISKNKNLHFVLVGDGKLKPELMAYSESKELSENVTFLGFVENAKQLIPEMDILLFTSVKEGLGSTILDFFTAKKPVVTVKNGGSEDLIIQAKTGFICEQKDIDCLTEKVLLLLDNPDETEKITEQAYQFVCENFSIGSVTEKTIEVYRELLE